FVFFDACKSLLRRHIVVVAAFPPLRRTIFRYLGVFNQVVVELHDFAGALIRHGGFGVEVEVRTLQIRVAILQRNRLAARIIERRNVEIGGEDVFLFLAALGTQRRDLAAGIVEGQLKFAVGIRALFWTALAFILPRRWLGPGNLLGTGAIEVELEVAIAV